jgi:2-oxoglutarate ferredoxin oxidoreductase subunit beta
VLLRSRGERITTIFINNATYGMTSGQMAPTTLVGQVTTTSPGGRDPAQHGFPIRVCELLATLEGPAYIERVSVHDIKNVNRAKKAIEKAFRLQAEGRGFTFVEVLSTCPTNWGKDPTESMEWVKTDLIPHYPLGVFRDIEAEAK